MCCLLACKKESNGIALSNSNYALIFGKWILQKQHVVISAGSSKTIDTTYAPRFDNYAEIQFNPDNSYVNTKYYPTGNGNIGQAALLGLYGFEGPAFSMSNPGIVGLRNGDPQFSDAVNAGGLNILSSYSIKINQLTASNLEIDIVYVYSYNYGSQNFKVESDFYFAK
ncbi:MAG: hypothetical protein NVSMB24_36800 [Mucilaginibacter sp.]